MNLYRIACLAVVSLVCGPTSASAQSDDAAMHPIAAEALEVVCDDKTTFVMAVRFQVREGKSLEFLTAMETPLAETVKESGNRSYELSQDPKNAGSFLLYEKWVNVGALDSHLKQPYLVALGAALGELLVEPPSVAYYVPIK